MRAARLIALALAAILAIAFFIVRSRPGPARDNSAIPPPQPAAPTHPAAGHDTASITRLARSGHAPPRTADPAQPRRFIDSGNTADQLLIRLPHSAPDGRDAFAALGLLAVADPDPSEVEPDTEDIESSASPQSDFDNDPGPAWRARGFTSVRAILDAINVPADEAWSDDDSGGILISHRDSAGRERLFFITPAAPPGDLTGDDRADAADMAEFLTRFAAHDDQADWNEDGRLTTEDLGRFLADWAAGDR